MVKSVWFWQQIISPHLANLASALANLNIDVTYVAEREMSEDRASLGWKAPHMNGVRIAFADSGKSMADLARSSAPDSLHLCQGLRGNGLIAAAQSALAFEGREQWVLMETVENEGLHGYVRRKVYEHLIANRDKNISGYLAIGHKMPNWLIERGVPDAKVFPFAYFLDDTINANSEMQRKPDEVFRIIFVGRFIQLKRLDLLIRALGALARNDVELFVIGSGPLEAALRKQGSDILGHRLHWIGQVASDVVPNYVASSDLLVLPSDYDGWGAVVSEAIMVGTPAVCSDQCGAADVVRRSGRGGVFERGSVSSLCNLLDDLVKDGPQTQLKRKALSQWGRCLGAKAGSEYLLEILNKNVNRAVPMAPWVVRANTR
jgi:glycosyltransferase involved in cell wall biosynthesis